MVTKIQKWGNDLAVRVPKMTPRALWLREGRKIELLYHTDMLVIKPVQNKKQTLKDLVDKITPKNTHRLVGWGSPQGKEIW